MNTSSFTLFRGLANCFNTGVENEDVLVTALKALCKSKGGHQVVAAAADVSEENLWQILNGTKLPSGNPRGVGKLLRKKIDHAFPNWLKGQISVHVLPDEMHSFKPAEQPPDDFFAKLPSGPFIGISATTNIPSISKPIETDHLIPQYEAGGAMGRGILLEDKQPGLIKSWYVDHEWLRLNVPIHTGVKNLCIVTGFGPSMKPLYNPGDPLLMDRGIKKIDQEGVFFFRLGELGYIKQMQRIPTESGLVLRAKSLNPTYDPFDINVKQQKMDFEVFGKILTVWRSEQV
jgi:hypothetical protein